MCVRLRAWLAAVLLVLASPALLLLLISITSRTVFDLWPHLLPAPAVVALARRWGDRPDSRAVVPFTVPALGAEELDDLRARLRGTRTGLREGSVLRAAADDWSFGVNHTFLNEALRYWHDDFDHAAAVARLNRFDQFRTTILGLDIHFWHVRGGEASRVGGSGEASSGGGRSGAPSSAPELPTILCLHGWPGSVYEFHEAAALLQPSYNLVIPSLPGYGWSSPSTVRGLGPVEIGEVFRRLMRRLGHRQYYLQGGDWGAIIVESMSRLAEKRSGDEPEVLGMHVNMPVRLGWGGVWGDGVGCG